LPEWVQVQFKGNRKEFFSWESDAPLAIGSPVIVEVERGRDLGHVAAFGEAAQQRCGAACAGCDAAVAEQPVRKIVRSASSEETHLIDELRKAELDVRRTVIERVESHGLNMKISDAEWQWDRKKLTIYFTAEKRVDFRALVRDLAGLFRTRIELRQFGARDEAKRLDGLGRCGRQYCCSLWLTDLKPVSLSLAKDQSLSLNPSQISGGCGRLLCCLRYEHEFYVASRKRYPREGRTVRTAQGVETVLAVDIFRERVLLKSADGATRPVLLSELKREVQEAEGVVTKGPPKPPSALVTFDEGAEPITPEQAADVVSPRKRRRRKKRGKRRGRADRRRRDGDDRSGPDKEDESGQ